MSEENKPTPSNDLQGFMRATGVVENRAWCASCRQMFPVVPNDPEPKCPNCQCVASKEVPLGDSPEAVAARANLR